MIIDKDQVSHQERPAHHSHIARISLFSIGILAVHKLANRQFKLLLHISLLVELIEEFLHPLVEDMTLSDHLKVAADAQTHGQDQLAVLYRVSREVVVTQFRL